MGLNVMMDSTMFLEGWHPCIETAMRNYNNSCTLKTYMQTQWLPKYYFIDFGISRQYNPANELPFEALIEGGNRTVPEFQGNGATTLCDLFPTDVYYIGNLIRIHVYKNLKIGFY
jgi:hypothetical protein